MPSAALKDFYVPAKKNINILRSHPWGTNLSTVNVTCIVMGFSFSYHLDSFTGFLHNNSIQSKLYLPRTLLLASMNVSALEKWLWSLSHCSFPSTAHYVQLYKISRVLKHDLMTYSKPSSLGMHMPDQCSYYYYKYLLPMLRGTAAHNKNMEHIWK